MTDDKPHNAPADPNVEPEGYLSEDSASKVQE